MIKAVKGTRDLLPPDTALWNHVESVVREVFRAYNFQEIRTPIFESTELFARGVGEETDIVSKEMFTWYNAGDPELAFDRVWNLLYRSNYQNLRLAQPAFGEFEYLADEEDATIVISVRYKADLGIVERMRQLRTEWIKEGKPEPRFVLATLDANQSRFNAHALRQEGLKIETQFIAMPRWFPRFESLTLRPENTAGVVRAYIEHHLEKNGLNKLYYIGPQFRRERPQKGRYRQFYQIGAEVIGPTSAGSESPARDAEVLEMLATLLDRLGITDWNLELNSVGSSKERVKFNEALRVALEPVKDKMCADCQRRAVTNPLRVLDCKVAEDQPIIEKLPRIVDFLEEDSRKHFDDVQNILTKVGVRFTLNTRLVRGLDYYTRTAFEFTHGALGAQNAILGGGRYDGLAEALGSPQPAPGIGFAIGEDRLVMSLQEKTPAETVLRKPDVYVAPMTGMNAEAARLVKELRRQDLVIELGDDSFRLKKSFEAATKAGARYILIVGENEVKADSFALKNLASGEQVAVARGELAERIRG